MQQASSPVLTLIDGESLARPPMARLPTLSSQPFRPGEMPTPLPVRLPGPCRRAAASRAFEAGVPVGLWARAAIECARHVDAVASQLKWPAADLLRELEGLATQRDEGAASGTATWKQGRYANALRRGDPHVPPTVDGTKLILMLPDVVLAAWSSAANAQGRTIDRWAEDHLQGAPPNPHLWEAAAAEGGQTIAEWIYAAAITLLRRH